MATTAEQFWKIFRGRDDLYAINGTPTADGKVPCYPVREKVTPAVIENHLYGDTPIGVYPLVHYKGESWVGWGCSDIDVDDPDLAWGLHDVLNEAAIVSWVERSRSKGFHVWVFMEEPIEAAVMRNALLMAHKVADIPAVEVNPKRVDNGTRKELGNLVRLPYPASWNSGLETANPRQVMLYANDGNEGWWTLTGFLERAVFANPDAIRRAASLWQEPPRPQVANLPVPIDVQEALKQVPGLAFTIWRDGPLDGRDRSTALARLCHDCYTHGVPLNVAYTVLRDADRRMGKFVDRPDVEEQLRKLLANAGYAA